MVGVKGKGGKKGYGRKATHYRGPDSAQCTSCKIIKPYSEYTVGNPRTCRLCKRRHHFAANYGISLEQFDSMMKEQKGLCAVCLYRPAIYVDHNHKTGKVRGILCQQCNTAIGYFLDDVEVLKRAVIYIT